MSKLKKLFGGINMTWPKVIIFAIITGVYTGLINLVPALKDTSFQDIAITLEWWILFAVIIASNCKKPIESGIKVFVFFLISQPLVYLVEMPFLGSGIWIYYKYWAIITLLTLPGGMIANLVRKKNVLGTLVLSVALALVAMSAVEYIFKAYVSFPHHLLTVIFCIFETIVLIVCLIPKKGLRAIAATIFIVAFIGVGFVELNTKNMTDASLPEGEGWVCTFENEDKSVITNNDYSITVTYTKALVKDNTIICKDKNGKTAIFKLEVTKDSIVNLTLQQ